ncbi:MAG: NAD-dependent succinate-semialdehyde dehydrogenase [Bowdeniella nasicola]|nr:NAD-dependent succinate-semialdehyde dehydrogenase [Bowdeniella nasicola]
MPATHPTPSQPIPSALRSYVEALDPGHGIWIDGKAYAGEGQEDFTVSDPSTNEPICQIASASADQARQAVDAAARALPHWRATAPRERAELLRACYEAVIDDGENLAALMSWEMGKSLTDAQGEVTYAAEFFRWFSEEAVRSEGDYAVAPAGGTRTIVTHHPVGVAALVTPWNFPAAMATRKLAPALAAGCTTVLKPASLTPLTSLAITRIMHKVGVPAGVVNFLPSKHSGTISTTWLEDERVRLISFTGSTAVGAQLMEQAAKRIVNMSMELGGNAAFIVGPTADIDAAVDGAMQAKFRNGGQACTAANRFFVHRDVAEKFTAQFGDRIRALKVGPALSTVDIGPVVSQQARDDINELVEAATRDGATVIARADCDADAPGSFVPPTLVQVSDPHSPLMEQEIFGPIAPVYVYDDEAEMLRTVNAVQAGLASYVFGELSWALHLAEQIECGMVGVNRGLISDPAAPFGGMKQSGIGREGAREGIREFQETQYFSLPW